MNNGIANGFPRTAIVENNNMQTPTALNSSLQMQEYGYPPQLAIVVPCNFEAINSVGISHGSAMKVNEAVAMSQVRLQEYYMMKCMDYDFKQKEEMLKQNHFIVGVDGIPIVGVPINWTKLEDEFINNFSIVRIRSNLSRDGWIYMIRNGDDNKHVPMNKSEMLQEWENFVFDNITDDQDIEDSKIKRHGKRLIHKIVKLEESNLIKLNQWQLMFANGYYDLNNGSFSLLTPETKYFNRFSMLYEFHIDNAEPIIFNAMLADMFNNDISLINLAYEIMGAIIFPVSTLKKIYVFQGVSNGGKSRLANVIVKLLSERDIRIFNGLEGINSDFLQKEAPFCRLVYIRDAADKKMASIPCSNLKGFADGSDLNDSAAFKILICTNNRLATGADGYLPPSLVNRFAVLPFPKPMDNIDENIVNFENYHFEREKNQILNKAFRAFQKVFFNKGIFSTAVTINNCVETNEVQNEQTTDKVFSKLDYILNLLFVTTDQPDTRMTTANMISAINHLDPSIEISPETLGRVLKKYFGENLKPSRNSSGIYYNLAFKTFPT